MASKEQRVENFGKKTGFIIMFLIFTTILYFLLFFLKKLPENWSYLHIILITLSIALFGTLLKFLLK